MQGDIRSTALYREAEGLYRASRQPGSGLISDAAEVSAHGSRAVFTGTLVETLSGTPTTRIVLTDLISGDTRVLTFGPQVDRLPKFSPDGRCVAFLSDRRESGDFQLYLLDPISGAARATPRPRWLGRAGVHLLMLLERGYAVFFPNPRGSAGCGRDFARRVQGDLGGAETSDHLSGLDYLIERGLADPTRLGGTGISHGGYMSAWLITQDTRFAAAIPVSPTTNFVTEHLISNIPHFVSLFLADHYTNSSGKYFKRSPIIHAHQTKTPTLNICGALDRCTPPEEAMQFHNALLENGVKSVLVTYPQEGHGIRKRPASIDYAARVVAWFLEHMPAGPLIDELRGLQ